MIIPIDEWTVTGRSESVSPGTLDDHFKRFDLHCVGGGFETNAIEWVKEFLKNDDYGNGLFDGDDFRVTVTHNVSKESRTFIVKYKDVRQYWTETPEEKD